MSGGPYMVNFGSKLGQVQNPMAGAAAPNLATYNPVEGAIWSKWKPLGQSLQEGVEQGVKTGENLKEFPEQEKAMQLSNMSSAVDIAAKQAQIEQMEAQTYGALRGYQGPYRNATEGPPPFTPTGAANAAVIANKALGLVGLQAAQNPQLNQGGNTPSEAGTAKSPEQPQQQQPTQEQPTQQTAEQPPATNGLPIGVPPEVAQLSGTQAETPPTQTQIAPSTNGPISSARAYWYANNKDADLQKSPLNTPAPTEVTNPDTGQAFNPKTPQIGPDGRYYAGTKGGENVFWDPERNDTYIYRPEANGVETRFYHRYTNDDEWTKGVTVDNPQVKQAEGLRQFLTENQFDPKYLFGEGTTLANMRPDQLVSAAEVVHNMKAKNQMTDSQQTEMTERDNVLDRGNQVMQALQGMSPSDYNGLESKVKDFSDKYGNTPVVGDVLKAMNLTPDNKYTNLMSAYGAYLDAVRGVTTGNMRANPEEFKALLNSIGNPSATNVSFGQRFGNALNQQRVNYVDRVDNMLANGTKMVWQNPSTGEIEIKSPTLKRADALRAVTQEYVNNVRNDQRIDQNGKIATGNQPTAQASPSPSAKPGASPPLQTISSREDLANIPAGQGAIWNGKPLTPAQVQAAKNRYQQTTQGQ